MCRHEDLFIRGHPVVFEFKSKTKCVQVTVKT